MSSQTPDGNGAVTRGDALKNMLRLAEEMHHFVDQGRTELQYLNEEQTNGKSLVEELQYEIVTLKDQLEKRMNDSVSKAEHEHLKAKYNQLASQANAKINKQKHSMQELMNTRAEAEKEVNELQIQVAEAKTREIHLKTVLEKLDEHLVQAKQILEEIVLGGTNKSNTLLNYETSEVRNTAQSGAQSTQTLFKLREYLNDVETVLNESKRRLNSTTHLEEYHPITDLSDTNRPVKLAERFSELYDNEWTDAFESINKLYRDEQKTIARLLDILKDVATFCKVETQTRFDNILTALTGDKSEVPQLPTFVSREIKYCRKLMADTSAQFMFEVYVSNLRQSNSLASRDAINVMYYLKEAFTLCWIMTVQDPPVVFDEPLKHGETFKSDMYKAYTRVGQCVDFLVWPALLLHKSGHVLCKGVAQGFQQSIGEMPPVDELQRDLPDRPEAYQDSQSTLLNNKFTRRASLPFIHSSRGFQKPTYRASSSFLADLPDFGGDSGKPKRSCTTASEATEVNSEQVSRPDSHRTSYEAAERLPTSSTSVNRLPHNICSTSFDLPANVDITTRDINTFFNLLKEHNYSYAAVQRIMDKSKFDACYAFIKKHYG